MARMLFVLLTIIFIPSLAVAQQFTPADYMKSLEFYYYQSLTINKLAEVGCKKHMIGLPAWFSVKAVQEEILSKSPDKARENIKKFFANPSHRDVISDFFRLIDDQRAAKSQSEVDVMCAAMSSSNISEWHIYRKRYFEVSMNIDPKYLR